MSRYVRISFLVTEEEARQLHELAGLRGVPVAELIRAKLRTGAWSVATIGSEYAARNTKLQNWCLEPPVDFTPQSARRMLDDACP